MFGIRPSGPTIVRATSHCWNLIFGSHAQYQIGVDWSGYGRDRCGQETFRSLRLWDAAPPGPKQARERLLRSCFYLRHTSDDCPSALAQSAGVLGQHGGSISSVIQHEASEEMAGAPVPLVIMTHLADEQAVSTALDEADRFTIVREPTAYLHVAN